MVLLFCADFKYLKIQLLLLIEASCCLDYMCAFWLY